MCASWQVGVIPVLVHTDVSDEENGIGELFYIILLFEMVSACAGVSNFGKRPLRKDALSSDEEGPRLPLQHYRR